MGCTLRGASGLHMYWVVEKGGPEGCPFLQPAPPFLQPAAPPFCAARPFVLSSVQPASSSRLSFGNTALQLVLSQISTFSTFDYYHEARGAGFAL